MCYKISSTFQKLKKIFPKEKKYYLSIKSRLLKLCNVCKIGKKIRKNFQCARLASKNFLELRLDLLTEATQSYLHFSFLQNWIKNLKNFQCACQGLAVGRAAIFLSLSSTRPADLLERPPKVTSTTLSKVSHYSGGPRRWLTLCGTQYKVTPVLEFIELTIGY